MRPFYWKNSNLFLIDQKQLPQDIIYVRAGNHQQAAAAIKNMVVRGAPAIGITAAFGMALACNEKKFKNTAELLKYTFKAGEALKKSRPTAVNLSWAVERMKEKISEFIAIAPEKFKTEKEKITFVQKSAEKEALNIWAEDIEMNKKISKFGAKLFKKNTNVITHCNAGALATGGIGTAVGVITEAYRQKKVKMVYADETRPYLQGARLTTWEFKQQNIPVTLITDNMAGYIMKTENVKAIVVGADRITTNGDTANKIGTYSLSILAKYHNVPFYVAAPGSTIDTGKKTGREIPIEERSWDEVTNIGDKCIAPKNIKVRHPAFDVTPSKLITAIITEKGVFRYPYNFK
ncbi:MAG: S-methyl-5-thioribose-1-phosphate isomerase [Elusimicrobia bacterium]|nr:S-methyl-5-thioribose-1-phosphate isomerase [Elusimicrobiota bacterium]